LIVAQNNALKNMCGVLAKNSKKSRGLTDEAIFVK